MNAGGAPGVRIGLDAADHREVADLGPGLDCAWDPGDQRALLGVGGTPRGAEPAIDAGRRFAARRRNGGERGRRPGDPHCLGAPGQHQCRGIQLVRAIGIARALGSPRIVDRTRNLQRLLDLGVIAPHLAPVDRPVGAVAEPAARLEPFRSKAQRHHREMNRAATDRLAAVVVAELDRVGAVADALVGPKELPLIGFVGSELVERPPPRPDVEGDDRKPRLGEAAGERAAASPGADDGEIDRLAFGIFAHRHPAAGREHIGRAAVFSARHQLRIIRHGNFSSRLQPHGRAWPRPLPTGRVGRNSSAHSRAGSPARQSRSRSKQSDGRNRLRRCRAAGAWRKRWRAASPPRRDRTSRPS